MPREKVIEVIAKRLFQFVTYPLPRSPLTITLTCLILGFVFLPVWLYFPECKAYSNNSITISGWMEKNYRTIFRGNLTSYGGTTFWSIGGFTFIRFLPIFDGNEHFDQGSALTNASNKAAVRLGAGDYDGEMIDGKRYHPPPSIIKIRKMITRYGWDSDCDAMRAIMMGVRPRGLTNGTWKPEEEYRRKPPVKEPVKLR
ncbi:MAG: hypothetical protein GKS01_12565 [Alphaproteobacteria bacterium]|nr:hypothetical protein [Alphaproteobacteria bacterium]